MNLGKGNPSLLLGGGGSERFFWKGDAVVMVREEGEEARGWEEVEGESLWM